MKLEFRPTKFLLTLQLIGICLWLLDMYIIIMKGKFFPSIIFVLIGIGFIIFHIEVLSYGLILKKEQNAIKKL